MRNRRGNGGPSTAPNCAREEGMDKLEGRRLLSSPIVITRGGTYSGTWESFDPHRPAVTIRTSQPVTIINSTLRGRGDLIASAVDHVKLTVKNTKGYGQNPNVSGRAPGRFVDVEAFDNIDLEGNFLEGTSGIYVGRYAGDHTSGKTVRVLHNRAHNIDGRKSNGSAGGWMNFNSRQRISDGHWEDGYVDAQFVQVAESQRLVGAEIAWNEVVNDPGNSRVEDNISIYKSSGTSASPIRIHDNYIRGAYTIAPGKSSYHDATWRYDWSYSGGGIMLGDGKGATAGDDPAFVKAYDNQVVSTTNYGIAIAAGHDMEAHNNRVISAGVLADGTKIAQQNVGVYVWDSYHAGASRFYHNTARANVSGWVSGSHRNDWWSPTSGLLSGNVHWSGSISRTTESAEWNRWLAKLHGPTPQSGTTTSRTRISGYVYLDLDRDGNRDASDKGLAGWRVYADANHNGRFDGGEVSAVTDSTGYYRMLGLGGGTYQLRVVMMSGYTRVSPTSGYRSVTLSSGGGGGYADGRSFAVAKM